MTYQNTLKLAKSIFFAGLVLISAPAFADTFVQPAGLGAPNVAYTLQWDTTENYREIYNVLVPQVTDFTNLMAAFIAAPAVGTYDAVLAEAALLVAAANLALSDNSARVVVTLPDGAVVVDTAAGAPGLNTYANYQTETAVPYPGTIGINHNSRLAIITAQAWPNGVGIERKYSTTVDTNQIYVAIRLGALFNNVGTVRLSTNSPAPS